MAAVPQGLELAPLITLAGPLVGLRHAGDGSGRLFAVRQSGEIVALLPDGRTETFLFLGGRVADGGERGLLGLAFHPAFADNGYFFVNYTAGEAPGRSVIARYRARPGEVPVDPAGGQIVLEVVQDFANHNGGDLHFGPDGYLYIGLGDGGGRNDPRRRAQDPGSLLGKLLRIDVDVAESDNGHAVETSGGGDGATGALRRCSSGNGGRYAIPPDNPFVGRGDRMPAALFADGFGHVCPEIWAFGLRNPWRWSFDRDGNLFVGDVGQDAVEEIDLIEAGAGGVNLGWPCFEGDRIAIERDRDAACRRPALAPVLVYTREQGQSVTGGYRYRGRHAPLAGRYLYADFLSGRIWIASPDTMSGGWRSELWRRTELRISSFGEDEAGELYLVDLRGAIYRLRTPD